MKIDTNPTPAVAKVYPPSKSASGDNGYYLKGCPAVEHSPAYAACLFKIELIEKNNETPTYATKECVSAITKKTCAALGMRQEEELAGVALYYFERRFTKTRVITNLSDDHCSLPLKSTDRYTSAPNEKAASSSFMPAKKSQPIAPVVTQAVERTTDTDSGYAAAINAAMTEAMTAPAVPVVTEPEAPKPRPAMMLGESPLQYARRVAASR